MSDPSSLWTWPNQQAPGLVGNRNGQEASKSACGAEPVRSGPTMKSEGSRALGADSGVGWWGPAQASPDGDRIRRRAWWPPGMSPQISSGGPPKNHWQCDLSGVSSRGPRVGHPSPWGMKSWLLWAKTMTISFTLHICCLGRGCHINPRNEVSLVSYVICDLLVMTAWSRDRKGPQELQDLGATRSISDVCQGRAESHTLASPASVCSCPLSYQREGRRGAL